MIDRVFEVTRMQPIEDRIALLTVAIAIACVLWLAIALIGSILRGFDISIKYRYIWIGAILIIWTSEEVELSYYKWPDCDRRLFGIRLRG